MRAKLILAISLYLLTPIVVCAQSSPATTARLAQDPAWLTLLHYEPRLLSADYKSSINTGDFFLSPAGNTSPQQELEATISAFLHDNEQGEMQCRFPARFLWLSQRVDSIAGLAAVPCPQYQEWINQAKITSLSMVFAAGHMKSPASYFGHNFLKFNSGTTANNHLLDQTINYGAQIPTNEGGLTYLVKGIFGGYEAIFESQQFFVHMAAYGEEDLRDVWEYVLDLSPAEIDLVLLHMWELQEHKLTYYFFSQNCAYQIAKLLGLVSPERLVPRLAPWTMPYNVFEKLAKVRRDGKPLVKDIIYHPSRRSRFHQSFFSLTPHEKRHVTRFIANPDRDLFTDNDTVNGSSKLLVVDTLIDYFEFRLRADPSDNDAKQIKQQLLLKRFSYPPSPDTRITKTKPYAPHQSQKPGYLSLAAVHNSTLGSSAEIAFRPAYFDALSLDIGRSTSGSFTLLDSKLAIREGNVRLKRMSLIEVTNLAPSITGIAGDSSLSWHFRLGVDQTNNSCQSCRRPMLDWTAGRAWKQGKHLTTFALAGARVQKSYDRDNNFALQLNAGITGQLSKNIRVHATAGRHEDTGPNGFDRNHLTLDVRLGDHRSWDVRLLYKREATEEFAVSAGYYW